MSMWKVVSGEDFNGILVRQGKELASPVLEKRLSFGAWVSEIDLVDGRLCYSLIEGEGPVTGWVTVTLGHKKLLARDTLIRGISDSRWLNLLASMNPKSREETALDSLFKLTGCGCGVRLCDIAGLGRLATWPIAVQRQAGPPEIRNVSSPENESVNELQLTPRKGRFSEVSQSTRLSMASESTRASFGGRRSFGMVQPERFGELDDTDSDSDVDGFFGGAADIEDEYAALDGFGTMSHSIELEYAALSVSDADQKKKLVEEIDISHRVGLAPLVLEAAAASGKSNWQKLLCSKYRQSPIKEKVEIFAKAAGITEDAKVIGSIEESFSLSDASGQDLSPRKLFKEFKSHGGA